jgi:hypothetical protein
MHDRLLPNGLPLAPSFKWAVVLFLCREALVEMDVSTRQSYVAALVRPVERTFASGITNLARNLFLRHRLRSGRRNDASPDVFSTVAGGGRYERSLRCTSVQVIPSDQASRRSTLKPASHEDR